MYELIVCPLILSILSFVVFRVPEINNLVRWEEIFVEFWKQKLFFREDEKI